MLFLFVESIIVARLLSQDSFGTYVLLLAAVNVLVIVADFGMKASVIHMLARDDEAQAPLVVGCSILFRLVVVVLLSVALLFVASIMGDQGNKESWTGYVGWLPLMFALASFDELLFAILQGFRSYRSMTLSQVIRCITRPGLTALFLGPMQLGIDGLIYSWALSFAASVAFQFAVLPVPRRLVFSRDILRGMLGFGLPMQLTRVLWFAAGRLHVVLLGAFAGPAAVASFAVAARIPDAIQTLTESFQRVYFPTIVSLLASGRRDSAEMMFTRSLRLVSFACAFVAIGGFIFRDEIVSLVFSDKYSSSALVFGLLMLAFHMTVAVNVMGYTLVGSGFPARSLTVDITRTLISGIGDLLLITPLGVLGSAFAAILSSYAGMPVAVWQLRRSNMRGEISPAVRQTALLLACSGLAWWQSPTSIFMKAAVVLLYVLLSFAIAAISIADLSLVVPKRFLLWPRGVAEPIAHGR